MDNSGIVNIGILGGGQLGRMLLQSAINYNVRLHILDPDPQAPCRDFTPKFTMGSFKDKETILSFAKNCDVISIEIEQVNTEALVALESLGKKVIPSSHAISMIQDKGLQKDFFITNEIPTLPYTLIENSNEILQHKDLIPGFLKLRKEGYDGKGVMEVTPTFDTAKAFQQPCILEKKCHAMMELSVMVVVDGFGNISSYEPVESVFNPQYHLVDYLISPARVSALIAEQAKSIAEQCVEALNSPGIFAVEMFLDSNSRLYVNEVAPRPHNSGHAGIEANTCSQFDQLIRILSGMPIGETTQTNTALMLNVIGEENYQGKPIYQGMESLLSMPGVYLHLYGKAETRAGRKMGHITILDNDVSKLLEKAKHIKNIFKVIS